MKQKKKSGFKKSRILSICFVLAASAGFTSGLYRNGLALEDVNIHVSQSGRSPVTLIFETGQQRGFYGEEGLQIRLVGATMQAGIQGLVAGSFHFSQILGQSSAAILRGAPLRIVMVFDQRPLWWLYGAKTIRKVEDLKGGKIVVVSGFGSALDQMTRAVLVQKGIEPGRDVVMQVIGSAAGRLAALVNGSVHAVALNPIDRLVAEKNGLNELVFFGDILEQVSAGVAVSEPTLSQRPEFVRRFLRGTYRGFLHFKSHEKETVSRIVETYKISEAEGLDIYKATLRILTPDGTMPRDLQERVIEFQRTQLKAEKIVSPENVYDFSMLRTLHKEAPR